MLSLHVGSTPVSAPVVTQRRNSWTYNIEPALKAGVPADKLNAHIDDIEREIEESGMREDVFQLRDSMNVEMRFMPAQGNEGIQDELILRPKQTKIENNTSESDANQSASAEPEVVPEVIVKRRGAKVVKMPKERAETLSSLVVVKTPQEPDKAVAPPLPPSPKGLHRLLGLFNHRKKAPQPVDDPMQEVEFPAEGIPQLISKAQGEVSLRTTSGIVNPDVSFGLPVLRKKRSLYEID